MKEWYRQIPLETTKIASISTREGSRKFLAANKCILQAEYFLSLNTFCFEAYNKIALMRGVR